MADEIPSIQVLDKKDYFKQALVSLPNALPYPALAPSSLRLRTTVLSLTVNNFTQINPLLTVRLGVRSAARSLKYSKLVCTPSSSRVPLLSLSSSNKAVAMFDYSI
ncbi:hypothetical protein NUW58_g7387 [Xylaria curta]|uniref:Uncharacterized protein n=1 Tax=Xylaria curta TaxID=42375 RepID=A0ACC1NIT4_9PEZI|nr:hypothetical protein NUW58_g7387 [Xylaria curta]